MTKADLRIDPLTGAHVVVTPWRQQRPHLPQGPCPFCPGGLEAPGPYDVRHFANRWPALPDGRHGVVLHSPDHDASFPALGEDQAARVVELWSARTAALGSPAGSRSTTGPPRTTWTRYPPTAPAASDR